MPKDLAWAVTWNLSQLGGRLKSGLFVYLLPKNLHVKSHDLLNSFIIMKTTNWGIFDNWLILILIFICSVFQLHNIWNSFFLYFLLNISVNNSKVSSNPSLSSHFFLSVFLPPISLSGGPKQQCKVEQDTHTYTQTQMLWVFHKNWWGCWFCICRSIYKICNWYCFCNKQVCLTCLLFSNTNSFWKKWFNS